MRLLLIGKSGQLGSDFAELAAKTHSIIAPSRNDCDLMKPETLRRTVKESRADVVLNAAAYNDVVGCETDLTTAFQVNAWAPRELALACREVGSRFITISTDYVFDGEKKKPYEEDDPCRPLQTYGITKLTGELGSLAAWDRTCVVRTCGLYGKKGSRIKGGNFVEHRLKDAATKSEVEISSEQIVSPTSTLTLSRALLRLAENHAAQGTFHLVNEGQCSWYEFTAEIFRLAGVKAKAVAVERKGEFGGVRRPRNSALANRRGRALGIELPDWKSALKEYLGK